MGRPLLKTIAQGPHGLTAYEVWLAEGNVGTEADFLADIRGPVGPSGGPFPDLTGVPAGQVPRTLGDEAVEFVDLSGTIDARTLRGNLGEGYGVVAGVIRQATQAGGWEILTPEPGLPGNNHVPINLDNVTKSEAGRLVLQYGSLGAVGTGSLLIVPDETYARMGIFVGASVGRDLATIQTFKRTALADRIYWTGSAWATGKGADSPFSNFSMDAGGVLSFSHPVIDNNNAGSLSSRGASHRPVFTGASGPTTSTMRMQFVDSSGAVVTTPDTSCEAYVDRGEYMVEILADDLFSPGGNLWIFGVFPMTEVHPDA